MYLATIPDYEEDEDEGGENATSKIKPKKMGSFNLFDFDTRFKNPN